MVDAVVFQFFPMGERNGEQVYDSLCLFLRRDTLYNDRTMNQAESNTHRG